MIAEKENNIQPYWHIRFDELPQEAQAHFGSERAYERDMWDFNMELFLQYLSETTYGGNDLCFLENPFV